MHSVYPTVRVIVLLIMMIYLLLIDEEAEMLTYTNHQEFEGLILQ
jgi:hypothetical protein